MKVNFEELIPQITEFLRSEAKTETVIGQQFELGEFHCVPVIRLGMGFGSGGGEGEAPKQGHGEGAGAGGGIGIEPIGFLVAKSDQISFLPTRHSSGLSAAFEKVPELIEKYMEKNKAVAAQN
ncbi:MAG: sporulation protein [Saprospiraceae bacterium]|nr:sporulation protein [Saprospiraceae bacterium]